MTGCAWPGSAPRRRAGRAAPGCRSRPTGSPVEATPQATPSSRPAAARRQRSSATQTAWSAAAPSMTTQNSSPRQPAGEAAGDQPGRGRQQPGEVDERPVAGLVPAVVVDPLEPVDVGDDEADGGAQLAVVGDRRVQPVVDGPPVREPGELVGVGQPGDAFEVLDLRGAGGDLARDRQREVEVLGAVRLVARGSAWRTARPRPAPRARPARPCTSPCRGPRGGRRRPRRSRASCGSAPTRWTYGCASSSGLDARVVRDRVDLVGPVGVLARGQVADVEQHPQPAAVALPHRQGQAGRIERGARPRPP